jgi:molybdopterin molybdotransferase
VLKRLEADAACDMLLALPVKLKTQVIPLTDSFGRVLAEDVHAQIPVPPFDRSPYDGYAFRGEDTKRATKENPKVLTITEELPAGSVPTMEVGPGQAAKVLTGSPIPPGANATIKYENTEFTDTEVRISTPMEPGSNIVRAGEDIPVGELIGQAGSVITGPVMGVLAAQGFKEVKVYARPVITLINTGMELAEVGEPLPPARIYNSNFYTLKGYLTAIGANTTNGGIVEDDPDKISQRIYDSLSVSDMIITTGGASVGDYDWAVTAAQRLGAEILFWKIAMKPGGSMLAATLNGKLILSLSGNPGAAVLGLLRIALPYIKKLCGRSDVLPQVVETVLKEPLKKDSPHLRLLRGRLEIEGCTAYFIQNKSQGNGSVSSLVNCDLLGEIPAGSPPLEAGTKIKSYKFEVGV